jgi:hypothetical protein
MSKDKSESVAALDELQSQLRSFFQPLAFRRHGRTYNQLTGDGLTAVIHFQSGAFDPPGTLEIPGLRENLYGRFTINLGIYVPEVAAVETMNAARAARIIHEYQCCLRTRLGHIGPEHRDLWWPARPLPELAEEIRARLESNALPFLRRFESRDAILSELRHSVESPYTPKPRIVCAIILAKRGRQAEARELLQAQADEAESRNPGHAAYVRQLAERLGLGGLGNVDISLG